MKLYNLPILIALFFFSMPFLAQTNQGNTPLTHILSYAERDAMQNHTRNFTETAPPTGEVRNIAEWESMESVLIAYTGQFGIPLSLIAEMSDDCNVTTIVANNSEKNTVLNIYNNNSVNTANCTFVFQDPDSYWTRDYSPWFIAIDDNEVAIVNFPYNRPRPNDNDVPILIANDLGIDLYGMDVTHTGGNYMCDGYGMAASTDLVFDEESQSQTQINTKFQDYLGIDTYHVTLDPLDDYIKHIDCWGKYIDVDKVMITQVPASDYRYDDYESVANYFASQDCSWGYPYEVIRVQAADYYDYDINPYTNSLILNNKVFVPQTGSSLDDDALAVYENAMPGYEIIGVYSDDWLNSDALHCRTHGVADTQMLNITHYPLNGNLAFQNNFEIEATVASYGGSSLISGFPKLYYKQNSGTWQEVSMSNTGGTTFTASIPGLSGTNTVSYYIYAENDNAKTASLPRMGNQDAFTFSYAGGTAGITDLIKADFSIFPNPTNGNFNINTALTSGTIYVYNIKGQEVYTALFSTTNKNIKLANVVAGIYVVKLESAGLVQYQKLIVE